MTIRSKLTAAVVLATILAAIAAGVLAVSFTGAMASIERMRRTDHIVKSVFQLKILSKDYRTSKLARPLQQWKAKYKGLGADLNASRPRTEKERFFIDQMKQNHASLGRSFGSLIANPVNTNEERMVRNMTAKMDAALLSMIANAHQLSNSIHQELRAGQKRVMGTVVFSSMATVLLIVGITLVIQRAAIVPLQTLEDGAAIIGAGDLTHRTGIHTKDEMGELSRAFDSMVDQLQSVMARRDELDAEVQHRKEAEEQTSLALDELRRSNDDLEQFAYSASHDLQEPLRKVSAFGSLLAKEFDAELGSDGHQYISIMQNATKRMQCLISDLLTYSRVTTRAGDFAPTDLNVVARNVLEDLEVRIKETAGTVNVGPLPTLEADPTQMRQLLQNLIANALKFHKEETPPVVNVTACEPPATGIGNGALQSIVVEDNGIGFDAAYKERIFRVFQRLHGRHQYGGSGIGLSVCRRIAERHKGSIRVESELGKGTTFTVTLPVRQPDEQGGGSHDNRADYDSDRR